MGTQRVVDNVLSVFDVQVTEATNHKQYASTRVVFTFDRKMGAKQFTLLNPQIPKDLHRKIKEWLDQNLDEQKIAYGLKSNRLTVQLDNLQ